MTPRTAAASLSRADSAWTSGQEGPARPALITYVPAHGGQMDDGTSGLGVRGSWVSFGEFGNIGGRAVVLDACDTASDRWLYDGGLLRSECQSLKNKPLLGGSGAAQPQFGHGAKILGALLDVLADVEDTAMSGQDLLSLLADVRERADMNPARNSTLRTAYAARMVTEHPSKVL